MRANVWLLPWASLHGVLGASAASAQALDATAGLERGLAAYIAGFPGGEAMATTVLCIAAGTLLIRLTRWFGLVMTIAAFGFLAVALLLAFEPQTLARIVEAVRLS